MSDAPAIHAGQGGATPAPALAWFLHDGQKDAAAELVKRFHYSHRIPGSVQLCLTAHAGGGLFGDFGDALAAIYFSSPPTRWSEPVLELSRLVRTPDCTIPLTALIGAACRWIRRSDRGDLIVSFADSTQGHHGGVYQASSWHYAGKRNRAMDGLMVNGVFVPGRTCNARWGTRSPTKLATLIPDKIEPHYDEGKHLYWRSLTTNGRKKAERLELQQLPYPKPAKVPTP